MRKRKGRRVCWYCMRWVDMDHPATYIKVSRRNWDRITYEWVYHVECWERKKFNEGMRKYKERLHEWT